MSEASNTRTDRLPQTAHHAVSTFVSHYRDSKRVSLFHMGDERSAFVRFRDPEEPEAMQSVTIRARIVDGQPVLEAIHLAGPPDEVWAQAEAWRTQG